jgi:hypothetical protein
MYCIRRECNLLWVNFKLAAVHCCQSIYNPSLQCCATTLAWCEEKDVKLCTLPRNINSRGARSRSTDVAAVVMEERQVKYWELTDWLQSHESWNSCVKQFYTHTPWGIILLCETWVWNWPCIETYTNWQRDFSAVYWKKIEWMEIMEIV